MFRVGCLGFGVFGLGFGLKDRVRVVSYGTYWSDR